MIKSEAIYITFENGTFLTDAVAKAIAYRGEVAIMEYNGGKVRAPTILFDFNGIRFTVGAKTTAKELFAFYESSLKNGSKRDSYWNLMQIKNR
jgi:hypothetical protein